MKAQTAGINKAITTDIKRVNEISSSEALLNKFYLQYLRTLSKTLAIAAF